jgi:hypothetical protein
MLIFVDGFAAASALFGGLELETGWPYRFSTTMLQGTPFSDYVVPGLILGLVVGGSATIATVETVRRASAGAAWSLIAGCIMAGWITGEVLLLDVLGSSGQSLSAYFLLQPFYFVVGAAMVALAIILAPDGWRGIARTTHMTRLSNWR